MPALRKKLIGSVVCDVLALRHASRKEITEFAGEYLVQIRRSDRVVELSDKPNGEQASYYAAPWRGDYLARPVDDQKAPPVLINGAAEWVKAAFRG